MSKQDQLKDTSIALNKKATHDYFIEERFEAGIVLEGWEVKSIRAGRAQLKESYILIKNNAAWLIGAHLTPLSSASTHVNADPTRTRKLLLNQSELNKLIGKIEQKGYTAVPLKLYWKKHLVKCQLGLAKGKKEHDKRETSKERDWQRERQRLIKHS